MVFHNLMIIPFQMQLLERSKPMGDSHTERGGSMPLFLCWTPNIESNVLETQKNSGGPLCTMTFLKAHRDELH